VAASWMASWAFERRGAWQPMRSTAMVAGDSSPGATADLGLWAVGDLEGFFFDTRFGGVGRWRRGDGMEPAAGFL
jgi:hypothetical protein